MKHPNRLRLADTLRISRLLAEVLELPPEPHRCREHTLRGLCALVDARAGEIADWSDFRTEHQPQRLSSVELPPLESLLSSAGRRRLQAWIVAGRWQEHPLIGPLLSIRRRLWTCHRPDLLDHRRWYAEPFVEQFLKPAGCDHPLLSLCRSSPQRATTLTLYRPWGEGPFTPRQRRMVRLFHLEFIKALQSRVRGAWLQRVDQLPPRQRQILLMLLKGQRPKQIAYELNISVATVREHASKIYERFDADDYGSLMSRFIVGPPIQNEARPFGALAERS